MAKKKLYIARKVPESLIKPFETEFDIRMWENESDPIPRDILLEEVQNADGLLSLMTENIDRTFLQQASHLNIIANMAVGYDNIDVEAAKEYDITITNTPDVLTETTADLTFALLMATARRLMEGSDLIRQNQWGNWSPFGLAGTDIFGKKLGIVGMGRIGEAVARRAAGFNMDVVYYNRRRKEKVERDLGVDYNTFDELIQTSDYIVSLLPMTNETENIFNQHTFAQMKSDAIFINASRGGVVDETALFEALKHKKIQAAGLDVFKDEPIGANHPFVELPNAVLLPHIGSATVATREKMITLALENIAKVFQGEKPKTPVW
ncbi:MAG TPA: D-glycerate dehydrogenase [Pseudogracilibacillus sp.]|nr:D-glycerate dehydrogenase [Pseudogracilibacillus sp.]